LNTIDDASLPGLVATYLSKETGRKITVDGLIRFPVGFSWLTYGLRVIGLAEAPAGRELILRLGPDYGLFAPYSAYPQALAMESLQGSGVPVPASFWRSDDPSILGAPFLFCERVRGDAVLPWASAALAPLEDSYRLTLATQFIDALGALHRTDWRTKSISVMGQGLTLENAAKKQIAFWQGEYERWASLPMYMGGTKLVCRLIEAERFLELYQAQVPFRVSATSVKFYRVFSLMKLAATHMAAARCFEDGRFNDLRMPAMGSQIIPVFRQMEKAIEAP
jgi:hypothetical protein